MVRKNTQLISGQTPLFTSPPLSGKESHSAVKTWQEIEQSPANQLEALAGNKVGPHIMIAERAERLVGAMNALAHRNMLVGLDQAVLDQNYKKPIWERYLDGTPRVINFSQSKVERLKEEAELDFWHATGFTALKGSGLVTSGQVRTKMNRYWRDFTHRIGDPKTSDERDALRKLQRGWLPEGHPYQTVKGWRQAREAERRRIPQPRHLEVLQTQLAADNEENGAIVTHGIAHSPLPKRTKESDALALGESRAALERINQQMATRRRAELAAEQKRLDRVDEALHDSL